MGSLTQEPEKHCDIYVSSLLQGEEVEERTKSGTQCQFISRYDTSMGLKLCDHYSLICMCAGMLASNKTCAVIC